VARESNLTGPRTISSCDSKNITNKFIWQSNHQPWNSSRRHPYLYRSSKNRNGHPFKFPIRHPTNRNITSGAGLWDKGVPEKMKHFTLSAARVKVWNIFLALEYFLVVQSSRLSYTMCMNHYCAWRTDGARVHASPMLTNWQHTPDLVDSPRSVSRAWRGTRTTVVRR
jgi:hypothetical protein